MENNLDAIVAGAGIWGCTVARRLAEAGKKVLVLEKRAAVGGNCRCEIDPETGIEVHTYGSHIFHTSNEEVWKFVQRFTEFNDYRHVVLAKTKKVGVGDRCRCTEDGKCLNVGMGECLKEEVGKCLNVEIEECLNGEGKKVGRESRSTADGSSNSNIQTFSNSNITINRRAMAEMKVAEWLNGVDEMTFKAALERFVSDGIADGAIQLRNGAERALIVGGAVEFFGEFSRRVIRLSDSRCVYFVPDPRSRKRGITNSQAWAEYAVHAVTNGGVLIPGKDFHTRWFNHRKVENFDLISSTLKAERCVPVLRGRPIADSIKFFGETHDGGDFDVVVRLDEYGNANANMTEVTFEASKVKKRFPRLKPLSEAVEAVVCHQAAGTNPPTDENSITFSETERKRGATSSFYTYHLPIGCTLLKEFFGREIKPSEMTDDERSQLFNAFIRGYTSKQWGVAPEKVDPSIIARLKVRDNYSTDYFNDPYQGIPADGYNRMFERMLDHPNISVQCNCSLCLDDYEVKVRGEGEQWINSLLSNQAFKHSNIQTIYYSGPIDALFNYKYGALPWRTLRFERETLPVVDYQGNSVVNYTDADVPYTRIHEFKRYHPEWSNTKKVGGESRWTADCKTIIMREYSAQWKSGDEPYYPINSPESAALLARYQAEVERINEQFKHSNNSNNQTFLILGGRLGQYKYYDMDKSIAAALAVKM